MRYLFVSSALPECFCEKLSSFGKVIPLPPYEKLPSPVASHPDTLMCYTGGQLFTYAGYTEGRAILDSLDIEYTPVSAVAGKKYPDDVALNCFIYKGVLFGRLASLAREILSLAFYSGCLMENVNQGYAHCASCLTPSGIITSDPSIIKAAEDSGINALRVSPGGIVLPGYEYGFIGGAGGCICDAGKDKKATLAVFGDIRLYPDGDAVCAFMNRCGGNVLSLGDGPLCDYGGIICLDT